MIDEENKFCELVVKKKKFHALFVAATLILFFVILVSSKAFATIFQIVLIHRVLFVFKRNIR